MKYFLVFDKDDGSNTWCNVYNSHLVIASDKTEAIIAFQKTEHTKMFKSEDHYSLEEIEEGWEFEEITPIQGN